MDKGIIGTSVKAIDFLKVNPFRTIIPLCQNQPFYSRKQNAKGKQKRSLKKKILQLIEEKVFQFSKKLLSSDAVSIFAFYLPTLYVLVFLYVCTNP